VDGSPKEKLTANLFRSDLKEAGIGDGHYSFDVHTGSDKISEIRVTLADLEFHIPFNTHPYAPVSISDIIDIQLSPSNIESIIQNLPRRIDFLRFDPNEDCNLRCAYCHNGRSKDTISLSTIQTIFDERIDYVGTFQVGCAMEPTLDPRLCDVIEIASQSKIPPERIALQTNGLLLHRHDLNRLRDSGLKSLSVSLDVADEQIQRSLRGGMSISKVLRNVEAFKAACPDISIDFICTVTKSNIMCTDELVELAINLGISTVQFREVFYLRENHIVDHSAMPTLVLNAGEFDEMRARIIENFGSKIKLVFANENTLMDSWENMVSKSRGSV
jgi:MoaA/NifB/PqqE/SkfB family radical SAM enzyme